MVYSVTGLHHGAMRVHHDAMRVHHDAMRVHHGATRVHHGATGVHALPPDLQLELIHRSGYIP